MRRGPVKRVAKLTELPKNIVRLNAIQRAERGLSPEIVDQGCPVRIAFEIPISQAPSPIASPSTAVMAATFWPGVQMKIIGKLAGNNVSVPTAVGVRVDAEVTRGSSDQQNLVGLAAERRRCRAGRCHGNILRRPCREAPAFGKNALTFRWLRFDAWRSRVRSQPPWGGPGWAAGPVFRP